MHFNCGAQEYKMERGGEKMGRKQPTDMLKNPAEKGEPVGVYPALAMTKSGRKGLK